MTRLADLKEDYKLTYEAYKDAKEEKDYELMKRLSEDLVRIADQMEYERG